MSQVFDKIIDRFPAIIEYIPFIDDESSHPPRKFFWDIMSTLKPDVVKSIIDKSHEGKARADKEQEGELIQVREDLLTQLENTNFVSSKCHDLTHRAQGQSTQPVEDQV